MPLFICSKCGCVENTATSDYWPVVHKIFPIEYDANKPFSISLPGWYKPVGIILFVLAMAVYNIGEYAKGYKHGFDDGLKECIEILEKK